MLKQYMLAFALIVAVSACSKKDDSASTHDSASPHSASPHIGTPPVSAQDSSKDTPQNQRDSSEGRREIDKNTSQQTETKEKKQTSAARNHKTTGSNLARRWSEFQAMVDRCDAEFSAAREDCIAKARQVYRSSHFKCDALPTQQDRNCREFAERWSNTRQDTPTASVTHSEEPPMTTRDPGDPSAAERNRDSTKQH
jgi:hypothetical protein